MRGTGYAVAEIIFWMLAAAVVGAIIGWLLCRWSMRKQAAGQPAGATTRRQPEDVPGR